MATARQRQRKQLDLRGIQPGHLTLGIHPMLATPRSELIRRRHLGEHLASTWPLLPRSISAGSVTTACPDSARRPFIRGQWPRSAEISCALLMEERPLIPISRARWMRSFLVQSS